MCLSKLTCTVQCRLEVEKVTILNEYFFLYNYLLIVTQPIFLYLVVLIFFNVHCSVVNVIFPFPFSLGGNCMTSMIATCSLDKKNLDVSCIIIKDLSSSTLALWYRCMHHFFFFFHHKIAFKIVKVHLTPFFFFG